MKISLVYDFHFYLFFHFLCQHNYSQITCKLLQYKRFLLSRQYREKKKEGRENYLHTFKKKSTIVSNTVIEIYYFFFSSKYQSLIYCWWWRFSSSQTNRLAASVGSTDRMYGKSWWHCRLVIRL